MQNHITQLDPDGRQRHEHKGSCRVRSVQRTEDCVGNELEVVDFREKLFLIDIYS